MQWLVRPLNQIGQKLGIGKVQLRVYCRYTSASSYPFSLSTESSLFVHIMTVHGGDMFGRGLRKLPILSMRL